MTEEHQNNQNDRREDPRITAIHRIAEFEEFAYFLGLPKFVRQEEFGFANETEFAHSRHVNPDTVNAWKKREDFWNLYVKKKKEWGRLRTPEVLAALYLRALKEGRAPEVRQYLEYFDDWMPTTKIKLEGGEMSEESQKIIEMAVKNALYGAMGLPLPAETEDKEDKKEDKGTENNEPHGTAGA